VWVWATNAERVADTFAWFPSKIIMSFKSSADATIAASINLTNALYHPSPMSPICPITTSQHEQLQQLTVIFNQNL
jgi:hypothetical protein